MLTCQELVELITDYVEGELDRSAPCGGCRHLGECDDCLEYASQLQQTERVLATMPMATVLSEDRAALIATYRDWCARKG